MHAILKNQLRQVCTQQQSKSRHTPVATRVTRPEKKYRTIRITARVGTLVATTIGYQITHSRPIQVQVYFPVNELVIHSVCHSSLTHSLTHSLTSLASMLRSSQSKSSFSGFVMPLVACPSIHHQHKQPRDVNTQPYMGKRAHTYLSVFIFDAEEHKLSEFVQHA